MLKYIPDFFLPKYKASLIENIYLDEKTIGYIIGNNTKEIDFNEEKEVEKFLININKLNLQKLSTIYIEGCDRFNRETINNIESKSGYRFKTGDRLKTHNIKKFLIKISKLLYRELNNNDLLIVSKDKDRLSGTIKILPKELNCIANIGVNEEKLYQDILNETGVSIYEPYIIEKAIKNFHIIINYCEENLFHVDKIRNQGIVLDFSKNKSLRETEKLNKNIIYIEDFNFLTKLNSPFIDKYMSSRLYETIYGSELAEYAQVYALEAYWNLEEYIDLRIRKRGRL